MLKVRVIPMLLYRQHTLVKSVRFDPARRVGAIHQAIRVYNMRDVDELVLVDIAATVEGRIPDLDLIDEIADDCFMPLAVGGGIRSVAQVRALLAVGADKVVVNTAFAERPQLVAEIAAAFGSQAVIVAIDARRENGRYRAFARGGREAVGSDAVDLARLAEREGCGEVLITAIDRDGTMEGYDIDLIGAVANAVAIPVIAAGGCGSYAHMAEALAAGASAVAAASIFHFTEMTPRAARDYLGERGYPVRQ